MKNALCLPCSTCSDRKCENSGKATYSCKRIDEALTSGKAWPKRNTYNIDLRLIEESSSPLNDWQLGVLSMIHEQSDNKTTLAVIREDLEKVLDEVLSSQERLVIIQLFFDMDNQTEIAKNVGVSQPRINKLKKRALIKLRECSDIGFLYEELKQSKRSRYIQRRTKFDLFNPPEKQEDLKGYKNEAKPTTTLGR